MKRLIIICLLSTCTMLAMAQVDTQFWFAAPWMNSHHTGEAEFHLIFSAYDHDVKLQIHQPAWNNRLLADTIILANSYCDLIIGPKTDHKQYAEANLEAPYNTIAPRGLLITADYPVSAYYQITHANGEAYTLKGKNALGTEFVVMSQMNFANYPTYNGYQSHNNSIQVVATQDNTSVTITPTNPIIQDDGSTSTAPVTVTLNRGETYAVKSATTTANAHLMGTKVTSTKPIAVTTSDDSVESGNGQDAVGEQLVPTDMAGTDYTVIPLSGSTNEYLYVIALNNNTNVTLTNSSTTNTITLSSAGDWQGLKISDVTYIHADNDVQVFQFINRQGESGATILPQMLCTGSKHVTYKRIPNSTLCLLNILTQTENISYLTMNGNAVPASSFKPVPGNATWSYTTFDVTQKPAAMPVELETQHGVFHLGVVDYTTIPQGTLTYGFFSDYATTSSVNVTYGAQDVETSLIVEENDRVVLVASAADGVGDFTWWHNGQQVGSGDTLVIDPATPDNDGTYEVRANSLICTVEYATFTFTVNPEPEPEPEPCDEVQISYPEQICAEDGSFFITLTTKGTFTKAELIFSDLALASGFTNIEYNSVGQQLKLNLPADLYIQSSFDATLILYPRNTNCEAVQLPIHFIVQYPTMVLTQRWNDVLSVVNERYNRGEGNEGYKFTAFQWYKNGEPISGATGSYYYTGEGTQLDFDAYYQVLLTREDGTTVLSCPFTPQYYNGPDIPSL